MAIPKKGTRKISIGDKAYSWLIRVDYDYFTKFFVIESVEDDRYQVIGYFEYERDLIISPRIIKQAIQQAIEGAWKLGVSKEKKFVIDITKIQNCQVVLGIDSR